MRYIDIYPQLHTSQLILGLMRINKLTAPALDTLIQTALDLGINYFDLADIYGGRGRCETLFGELLKRQPDLRNKMVIQSKCGIVQDDDRRNIAFNFAKDYILQSTDGILQRLGIDQLDVLLLHRPDTLMEPDEIAEAFNRLEAAGKVRYFGVSNFNRGTHELLQSAVKQPLKVNQLQFGPAFASLVDHSLRTNTHLTGSPDRDGEVLDYCRLHGITIQAWSPFQYGQIAGPFLNNPKFKELSDVLAEVGASHGLTATGAVSAWITRHPARIQTVTGTTNPARLTEIAAGIDVNISREEWYRIYTTLDRDLP